MVYAKELMIGNYLFFTGEIRKVSSFLDDDTVRFYTDAEMKASHGCYNLRSDMIEPVELSPEILVKAGFYTYALGTFEKDVEATASLFHGVNFGCTLSYNLEEKKLVVSDEFALSIIYLHQLQNLYLNFTGEPLQVEIEIKPFVPEPFGDEIYQAEQRKLKEEYNRKIEEISKDYYNRTIYPDQ